MRILALLVVLLYGLVSVCGATDAARQSSPQEATADPSSSDLFNSLSIANHDSIKLPANDRGIDSERHRDVTCYTMHIFGMKRESPDSDVTVPDGQWTCRRASKYSMKTVEQPDQAPSR